MSNESFQKIIDDSRKGVQETGWSGTCLQYLELVKKDPNIAQLAPGRVYNMIMQMGTGRSRIRYGSPTMKISFATTSSRMISSDSMNLCTI